jgi:uncharacterized membrane protein YhaH (DUF805 family)
MNLKKFLSIDGRATRREFLNAILLCFMLSVLVGIIFAILAPKLGMSRITFEILFWIIILIVNIPYITTGIRRLHDIGLSGWWFLLMVIPYLNFIFLLFLFIKDSQPGENKYGPNPKEITKEINSNIQKS